MIEPQALVWPNIKAIWEANELEKPVFMWAGFAADKNNFPSQWALETRNKDSQILINHWPASSNGKVIGNHGFSNLAERPDIPAITIDMLTNLLGPPDALTIDVEGADYEVIMGAQKTLELHKPQIWISVHPEFMFNMYNHYSRDLFNMIECWGYKYELLAFDHEWHVRFWHPEKHSA